MIEIISTNIAQPKEVIWQGKKVMTGIYKNPVDHALELKKTFVENDSVIDLRYHGGIDKACYLFSEDHYEYWKEKYPNLDWQYGMFGENLTVKNCNEKDVYIGDTYEVGTAVVQVSQPRQPCFKLGIRFENQSVLKDFINQPYSGVYLRVIKEGTVKAGDTFKLIDRQKDGVSVAEVFQLLYAKQPDEVLLKKAIDEELLSAASKEGLYKKIR